MTLDLTLIAAFVIGLAGSPHCLGMCGGIAGSLGLATGSDQVGKRRWLFALCYNLGRLFSYSFLGALFALLVAILGISVARPEWGAVLRIATGLILLAMAAHLLFGWSGLRRIEVLGGRVWRFVGPHARRLLPVKSAPQALMLGALWGWLPCGLVYTVLLAAAVSGDPLVGASIMLAFGVGTLPAMTGVTFFGQALRRWQSGAGARRILGGLMLTFALWTLVLPVMSLSGLHGPGDHGKQEVNQAIGH